eukprot:664806-Pleurochrysis_carterae.AAC.2
MPLARNAALPMTARPTHLPCSSPLPLSILQDVHAWLRGGDGLGTRVLCVRHTFSCAGPGITLLLAVATSKSASILLSAAASAFARCGPTLYTRTKATAF